MNDQPQEPAAPTPPSPPAPAEDKAGGGMRALGVVLAIVLGFAAAVVIAVMVDLGSSPICADVGGSIAPTEDCFDVSSTGKALALITGWIGGVLGVLAALAWLAVAIRGRRVKLAAQLSIAAVVLVAISLLVA